LRISPPTFCSGLRDSIILLPQSERNRGTLWHSLKDALVAGLRKRVNKYRGLQEFLNSIIGIALNSDILSSRIISCGNSPEVTTPTPQNE
jgi:hypothetical protein